MSGSGGEGGEHGARGRSDFGRRYDLIRERIEAAITRVYARAIAASVHKTVNLPLTWAQAPGYHFHRGRLWLLLKIATLLK